MPNSSLSVWNVCDARDGRVMLYKRASETGAFADLVVCDPLYRRYVQLPPLPIPDDLAVSTRARGMRDFNPFLDPASKEGEHEDGRMIYRSECSV
jgi:hypothetical protein